ncbi:hypothetical protein COCNU_16G002860 [Cocos nucifera]|uniref:Uncharacterized protein n=1 Tax=Cocos nucifera TaxID=13894 RepID=A0A8K0IY85_COCNU|nr:hypothetical protein COCNU_16G002860 [Cocos nucifera]
MLVDHGWTNVGVELGCSISPPSWVSIMTIDQLEEFSCGNRNFTMRCCLVLPSRNFTMRCCLVLPSLSSSCVRFIST